MLSRERMQQEFSQRGWFSDQEVVAVQELSGGVSNIVLRVTLSRQAIVLKRPLAQLRVAEVWLADVNRAQNEAEGLRVAEVLLPSGASPHLWEFDQEQHLLAMEAAPVGVPTWKSELLQGKAEPQLAVAAGEMLGALHAGSWQDSVLARRFTEGFRYFRALRLSPYFEFLLAVYPRYATMIKDIIADLSDEHDCLVHGDFSPKNLLVTANDRLMLIDWEVIHYGNPRFDVAFMVCHLTLKTLYAMARGLNPGPLAELITRFWQAYQSRLGSCCPPFDSVRPPLAGLLLARVGGKSPAEYLTNEDGFRVERWVDALLSERPDTVTDYYSMLKGWT